MGVATTSERIERPDPDVCPKCGQAKPLEEFRRRNGGLAVWCQSCRLKDAGNPELTLGIPQDYVDMQAKYEELVSRLREQRHRYGADMSPYAQGQMFVAEEVVRDFRALGPIGGLKGEERTWTK